jgi:hypothetical protein
VSKSLTNYRIDKAKFRGGASDAYFQNGEVTVSLALLLIQPATMLVTHNRKHIPFQSPYLHYHISFMLCSRVVNSGSDINISHIAN